ncbi:MAG: hypothetical protein EOO01_00865 [Chitinophagaceae bacterium]|nr:MAG: hypothetical protein EOO01_00865 [Chitinophagaceae bacterium]
MTQLTTLRVKFPTFLLFFLCFLLQTKAQQGGIAAGLQLHIPFDDGNTNAFKLVTTTPDIFDCSSSTPYRYSEDNIALDYTSRSLEIPTGRRLVISAEEHSFPYTYAFWIQVENATLGNGLPVKLFDFEVSSGENRKKFFLTASNTAGGTTNYLLKQYSAQAGEVATSALNNYPGKVNAPRAWRLIVLSIDTSGLSFQIRAQRTLTNPNPDHMLSSPKIPLALTAPLSSSLKLTRLTTTVRYLDDFRIYNRVLTKADIQGLQDYDPLAKQYIGQFNLAVTWKKLGDEYYVQSENLIHSEKEKIQLKELALRYYNAADSILLLKNGTDTLLVKNLIRKKAEEFLPDYYYLLLADVQYKRQLLQNHYSFWGADFTQKPMFPVQEYEFFKSVFEKFQATYYRIEQLLRYNDQKNEDQETAEMRTMLAVHKAEVDKIKIEEAEFKGEFYDNQLGNINSQLKAIESRQKEINREVERKEKELQALDAQILSTFSQAISQATLGVPIDPTKDLGSQLKTAGMAYLTSNPEFTKGLLGSYKDIYEVVKTGHDYYVTGKKVMESVKTIASGNISAGDLFKLGDAISESGLVDEKWTQQWSDLKKDYNNVEANYRKAKELMDKVKPVIRNGGQLKDIVAFVDWAATTDYIPENYRKQYEGFKGYRDAAYTAVKHKRYEDLVKIGEGLLSSTDPVVLQQIKDLRARVKGMKPAFVIIEAMRKNNGIREIVDLLIKQRLNPFIERADLEKFLLNSLLTYLEKGPAGQLKTDIVNTLCRRSPKGFLEALPVEAREDLKKSLALKTDVELYARLVSNDLSAIHVNVSLYNNEIVINGQHYPIKFGEYFQFDPQLRNAAAELFQRYRNLYTSLKELTDPEDIFRLIETSCIDRSERRAERSKEELYDYLMRSLDRSDLPIVEEETVKFYLGNEVLAAATNPADPANLIDSIPAYVDPKQPEEIYGESLGEAAPQGDNSTLMRDVATKALDMAFPGVGTAVGTALKIADNIFSGYDIINTMKDSYKEKITLNDRYIELLNTYRQTELNKQLSIYETKIANATLRTSRYEHAAYNNRINNIIEKKKQIRRKILGEIPLLFFYAERLRYYMSRLNKASTYWYGAENNLYNIIIKDKNNYRLALDPDIKLFDWVNAPDITSSRQDLDSLYKYWSNLSALITDGLTSQKLIFGDNVSELNFVAVDVAKQFPDQWKMFKRWQSAPNTPFVLNANLFDPLSYQNPFGFDSSYTSIKVVQVVPVVTTKDGLALTDVMELSNNGISVNEIGQREILNAKTRSSPDDIFRMGNKGDIEIPANYMNTLKNRWDAAKQNYQPYNYEGYNLRSNWQVKILPKRNAASIHQVHLIFFYQYTKNYNQQQENDGTKYLYKLVLTMSNGNEETILYESSKYVAAEVQAEVDEKYKNQYLPQTDPTAPRDFLIKNIVVTPYVQSVTEGQSVKTGKLIKPF